MSFPSVKTFGGRDLPAKASVRRVVVVVNKWWEANPVLEVLLNDRCRPAEKLGWPRLHHHPCPSGYFFNGPRAILVLDNVEVEVWCISDLLARFPEGSQSSSERKMDVLPLIFNFPHRRADLAVAVGTAASYPAAQSHNGSVIVGTRVFLHNAHPGGGNPESDWCQGPFDTLLDSSLSRDDFLAITDLAPEIRDFFFVPALQPAAGGGRILAGYDTVDLNTVNVTDYAEYEIKDLATVEAFKRHHDARSGGTVSVETTHGLVRIAVGDAVPFLFICGIVNRQGRFAEDVKPRTYAQDATGAHNAGIALAWMLPRIDACFGSGS